METMAEYLAELVKAGLEDRKAASLPEGVSVREIVKISEENHMDYLLLGALLKTDGLSEEEKGLLREKVLGSMLFTGMQLQELKKLEERMEQAKIPCQPMKGARMKFYYPSPFLREMSDIDILIHGDFMEQAAVELEAMGYVLQQKIKHHDIYRKAPGIVVEAHRAMYDRTVDERQYAYFSDLSRAVRRKGFLYVYDFEAEDGIRHRVWIVDDDLAVAAIEKAFAAVDVLYIADGHHRAASAFKVGMKRRRTHPAYNGTEEFNYFLAVLFPEEELKIMDYNRLVKNLNGWSKEDFLERIRRDFTGEHVGKEAVSPSKKGEFGMYLDHDWYRLNVHPDKTSEDPVDGLDVSILQMNLLDPVLGIEDPRTDENIEFVGGIRGLGELEKRCHEDMVVAFSMYPTSIRELLAVADAGRLMPPKSTWFEPKLRSGLFIHQIEK